MKRHFLIFACRWLGNSLVLALLVAWPASGLSLGEGPLAVFAAGLAITLVNAFLRPLLVLAALPFLTITLGFFTIAINYAVVFFSAKFYSGFSLESFWWGVIAGLAVAAVNYLVTAIFSPAD